MLKSHFKYIFVYGMHACVDVGGGQKLLVSSPIALHIIYEAGSLTQFGQSS